jgi:hypothetical protein
MEPTSNLRKAPAIQLKDTLKFYEIELNRVDLELAEQDRPKVSNFLDNFEKPDA